MEEGTALTAPIVEFYYKDDDLGDPLVTEDHIRLLNIATQEQVSYYEMQLYKSIKY